MPEDDFLRLDARDLRNLAALDRDDTLIEAIVEDAHRVLLSPETAALMLGMSAKAIRGAIDRGDLRGTRAKGRGTHRWLKLGDLVRRGLDAKRALHDAFDAARDAETPAEYVARDPDALAMRSGTAALLALAEGARA